MDKWTNITILLTNNASTEPYLRVLTKEQEFAASVDYSDWNACVRELEARNAFRESEEARLVVKPPRGNPTSELNRR